MRCVVMIVTLCSMAAVASASLLEMPLVPFSSASDELLASQAHGPIERVWNNQSVGGYRVGLEQFKQLGQGNIAGAYGWDNVDEGTVIAEPAGVTWSTPGVVDTRAVVHAYSLGVNSVGAIGTGLYNSFDNRGPRQLHLWFTPDPGKEVHGFAMVLTDSGSTMGGIRAWVYGGEDNHRLAYFDSSAGSTFHNSDDNFWGLWFDEKINYIAMEEDGYTLYGRFDEIGLIVTPEPTTCAFLAAGGLALVRRRRR